MKRRACILVASDTGQINETLASVLGEEYDFIYASSVEEAKEKLTVTKRDLALVILDGISPKMNALQLMDFIRENSWDSKFPVMEVLQEYDPFKLEVGATHGVSNFLYLDSKPMVIRRRISNSILLSGKQKQLEKMIYRELFERSKSEKMMTAILSHIVEFRNGESGRHVVNINIITRKILQFLAKVNPKYHFNDEDIDSISKAATLHDIGKIFIPDKILNKPGRFTPEEFAVMKQHSVFGYKLLTDLPVSKDEPLVKFAYEICRWHHERFDGRGYPDGLKGDEIPVSAQIVALADVYDALTSERCYKKAFTHEKAIEMILGGECGVFNPDLMECLRSIEAELERDLKDDRAVKSFLQLDEGALSFKKDDTIELRGRDEMSTFLFYEKERANYFYEQDVAFFSYQPRSQLLTFNKKAQKEFGFPSQKMLAVNNENQESRFLPEFRKKLREEIYRPHDSRNEFSITGEIRGEDGKRCRMRIDGRKIWTSEKDAICASVVGRLFRLPARE